MAETDEAARITESFVPGDADKDGAARRFHLLTRALQAVAGTLMFILLGLTFVDVVGRYGFGRPIPGGFEIIEFNMGLLIFAALPLVSQKRSHITVSLFDSFMGYGVRRFRDTVVFSGSTCVVGMISFLMFRSGLEMSDSNAVSRVYDFPLAPVIFVIAALGVITFFLLAVMTWNHLRARTPDSP